MKNDSLRDLVGHFPEHHVLVVGDVMLDEYVWGDVTRISPEAPIPVVDVVRESARPGGAANVMANVWSLAGRGSIVGLVGADATGEVLRSLLGKLGVDGTGLVVDEGRPTTLKRRIVAHGQQVVRVDRESRDAVGREACHRLADRVRDRIDEVEAVIISDYGKGVVTPELVQTILGLADGTGKPVVVDPKSSRLDRYRGVTIMTPNHHEVESSMGVELTDNKVLEEAGRRMLHELSCQAILITRGEKGMSLIEQETTAHIPTVAKEVYDVTGAGDTVVAAMALALSAGGTMLEAAHVSNHAAGLVVGKVGTAPVTRQELRADLRQV